METASMGRVVVEAIIENLQDVWDVDRGMFNSRTKRFAVALCMMLWSIPAHPSCRFRNG